MSSSKDFLDFVLLQLADLEQISYRAMMGEYVIYYRGKVVGGIFDNRFLIKPTKTAITMMPDASLEIPYPGAKEMLLMDVDDQVLMMDVIKAIYDELPVTKKKRKTE